MEVTTVKAAGACTTQLCHQIGFQLSWGAAWALLAVLAVIGITVGWLLAGRADRRAARASFTPAPAESEPEFFQRLPADPR